MADQPEKPKQRKKRRWLRRFFRAFLFLFLVVVIFHRPIIHHGGRWVAIWLARQEHMDLDLRLAGNVWSRFEIHDVKLRANGTGPAPVESASLDSLSADYSLWKLIHGDLKGIEGVHVGTVAVVITPQPSQKKEQPKEPKKPLPEVLQSFLNRPLPSPVLEIGRVDVTVCDASKEILVQNFHVSSAPEKVGSLGWDRIVVPGVPPMEKTEARLELTGDRFALSDLTVWPELKLSSANLDRLAKTVVVEVALPDGKLTATALPQPKDIQVEAQVETRGLEKVLSRFGVKIPMALDMVSAHLRWQGTPEAITASSLDLSLSASGKRDTAGWALNGKAAMLPGQPLQLSINGQAAESMLSANGAFDLSKTLAHRDEGKPGEPESKPPLPEGNLELRLTAPDLEKAAAQFQAKAAGKAEVAANVRIEANTIRAEATVAAGSLALPNIRVSKIEAAIKAELPITDAPPLTKLRADLNAAMEGIASGDFVADRVSAKGSLAQGRVDVSEVILARGSNTARVEARAQLQPDGKLTELPAVTIKLDAPQIAEFGLKAKDQPIEGALHGTAAFRVENEKFTGSGQITGSDFVIGDARVHSLELNIGSDNGATTAAVSVSRGKNVVKAETRALITAKGELAERPAIKFNIAASDLAEFGVAIQGAPLGGTVNGHGAIAFPDGQPNGNVQLSANNLTIGKAKAGELTADVNAENAEVQLKVHGKFNGTDLLNVAGKMQLKEPRAYEGTLTLDSRDLAVFQPILDAIGNKTRIAGAVDVSWSGSGDSKQHQGKGEAKVQKLRVNTLEITDAAISADYNPEKVLIPNFSVVADQLRASGALEWAEKRLQLKGLQVLLGGKPALTGEASVPLDPANKSVLPNDQPLSANLVIRDLDFARVFRELKLPPKIEGTVTATLAATGTLEAPDVKFDLAAKGLRLPEQAGTKPEDRGMQQTLRGDVEAKVDYSHDRIQATTIVKHAELAPLTVKFEAPLTLKPILEGKTPDFKTMPFKASANLPTSSLAFLPKLSPAITHFEGKAGLAIEASGTTQAPHLSGNILLDASYVRLANGSVPPISNLAVRVNLDGNKITLQRLDGETGGGRLSLTGSVLAADLANPVLDLRLKTDKVLVLRNDAMLVRVDCDVTARGPLNAGTAAGRVVLAQSRFNKEIQILPILMPGRPKPVPREVAQPTVISFPNPPLRDWKFDIAILTSNDDPFLVRGNLAKGQVAIDIRLQGTGLAPYLVGAATLEQFTAQLPVSKLTTRRGLVTFSRETPFEPRIELESETVIRGYTIVARLDGLASAPRLDLTSEPPLPQQEIMALLTTGSLASEIGQNNTALATRAGLMLLQEWYKKVFKRDFPFSGGSGDGNGESFMDRFSVDLGAVDSKTGRQEVAAKFRVSKRVQLMGDAEMGGGVGGRIQYVFRFR